MDLIIYCVCNSGGEEQVFAVYVESYSLSIVNVNSGVTLYCSSRIGFGLKLNVLNWVRPSKIK